MEPQISYAVNRINSRGALLKQRTCRSISIAFDILIVCIVIHCFSSHISIAQVTDSEQKQIKKLIEIMKSNDSDAGQKAAEELSKYGKTAVPYLIPALKDENPVIRYRAAMTLSLIGPSAIDAAPTLIELISDTAEADKVREAAALALGKIGPMVTPDLLDTLRAAPHPSVIWLVGYAYDTMGPQARTSLEEALENPNPAIRKYAAVYLGYSGPEGNKALPILVQIIQDKKENDYLRGSAAHSLGQIGPTAREATNPLVQIASDRNEPLDLRDEAVMALGVIDPPPDDVFGALSNLLQNNDEDTFMRRNAAISLGNIGKPTQEVMALLVDVIKNRNTPGPIRGGAAKGLGLMKSGAVPAIPELFNMLQEGDFRIRTEAGNALLFIPPQGKESDPKLAAALPVLMETLDKENGREKVLAINALAHVGPNAATALPALTKLLQSHANDQIRAAAAFSLGFICSNEQTAIQLLAETAGNKTESERVRLIAIQALGRIGPESKTVIPAFLKIIQSDVSDAVLKESLSAIFQIHPKDRKMLPTLTAKLDDEDEYVRRGAAIMLWLISSNLQSEAESLSERELTALVKNLEKVKTIFEENDVSTADMETLGNPYLFFSKEISVRQRSAFIKIAAWIKQHRFTAIVIMYVVFMPLFWCVVLLISPLSILRANNMITPFKDVTLPSWLGTLNLPLRVILFIKFFIYNQRVLDAWVNLNAEVVRENFQRKRTVRERSVHVDIPVVLDGKTVARFTAKDLRSTFNKQNARLLIWGEGGSGKTSLACQIALWSLSDDESERICEQQMLPVLIEQDFDLKETNSKGSVLKAIQGQLQDLVGKASPIDEDFLAQLLKQRRVVVIVDHLSELSDTTRSKIRPDLPDFPANALIVTSRVEENLGDVTKTTCQLLRISGNRLSSFMEAYLTQIGKRSLFNDSEFFDGCKRLSAMVGERQITALLAKLFAEQMISMKAHEARTELPKTVPDLMLGYLNELCGDASREELRAVQRDAKIIAWECVKKNFRPGSTIYDHVINALGGDQPEKRIEFFESKLRLIDTIGPALDQVRFTLDPLAEYLAAMFLVEQHSDNEKFWYGFINKAREKLQTTHSITEFIMAIRDCWFVEEMNNKYPELTKDLDRIVTVQPS